MKKDFIEEKPVEINLNGRIYKIKEPNGVEFDAISQEYLSLDEKGRLLADIPKRNSLWLKSLVVDAPYEKEGKPFRELKGEEKLEVLNKLKPPIRTELLKAINNLLNVESDELKNSKEQSSKANK